MSSRIGYTRWQATHFNPLWSGFSSTVALQTGQTRISSNSLLIAIRIFSLTGPLHRRTRHKRAPVYTSLEILVRRKNVLEGEDELCRPMCVEIRQPLARLVDARNMPRRHPPQGGIRPFELLEPLMPMPQQFRMHRVVDVMLQRLHCLPHRHIEQDAV